MSETVTDNTIQNRFELHMQGETVFANYKIDGDTIHLQYVEAPISLRGTGAAGTLMKGVVEIARARKMKIYPICGYAHSWLRRHPEYHDLLK